MSCEKHENTALRQFEILRNIVLSSSSGEKPAETARAALEEAGRLVGLSSGTLILWNEDWNKVFTVTFADTTEEKILLDEMETGVFSNLRKNKKLVSAYISFGGEKPLSSFTHPIRKDDRILGAVIGIQKGNGSLVRDDIFLEALAAALSVSFIAGGFMPATKEDKEKLKKERLNAIIETAATVNHEINNPLTAVLGNVQLLLMRRDNLDSELIRKLKVVEESALRIKEVTQKLMKLSNDNVTEYTNGIKMIDISDEDSNS